MKFLCRRQVSTVQILRPRLCQNVIVAELIKPRFSIIIIIIIIVIIIKRQ